MEMKVDGRKTYNFHYRWRKQSPLTKCKALAKTKWKVTPFMFNEKCHFSCDGNRTESMKVTKLDRSYRSALQTDRTLS